VVLARMATPEPLSERAAQMRQLGDASSANHLFVGMSSSSSGQKSKPPAASPTKSSLSRPRTPTDGRPDVKKSVSMTDVATVCIGDKISFVPVKNSTLLTGDAESFAQVLTQQLQKTLPEASERSDVEHQLSALLGSQGVLELSHCEVASDFGDEENSAPAPGPTRANTLVKGPDPTELQDMVNLLGEEMDMEALRAAIIDDAAIIRGGLGEHGGGGEGIEAPHATKTLDLDALDALDDDIELMESDTLREFEQNLDPDSFADDGEDDPDQPAGPALVAPSSTQLFDHSVISQLDDRSSRGGSRDDDQHAGGKGEFCAISASPAAPAAPANARDDILRQLEQALHRKPSQSSQLDGAGGTANGRRAPRSTIAQPEAGEQPGDLRAALAAKLGALATESPAEIASAGAAPFLKSPQATQHAAAVPVAPWPSPMSPLSPASPLSPRSMTGGQQYASASGEYTLDAKAASVTSPSLMDAAMLQVRMRGMNDDQIAVENRALRAEIEALRHAVMRKRHDQLSPPVKQ